MSSSSGGAKKAFEDGITHFKSRQYKEAVKCFDLAIKVGGNKVPIIDSRAAALEKLGKLEEAVADAGKVIELNAESARGYLRRAPLLEKLGKLKEALADAKMIVKLDKESSKSYVISSRILEKLGRFEPAYRMLCLALPKSLPADQPSLRSRIAELKVLKEEAAVQITRSQTNWVQNLPWEILQHIFRLCHYQSPDIALKLGSVSKSWRNMVLDDRVLWSNLRLGKKRSAEKAIAFHSRSGGRIVELRMVDVPAPALNKLLPVLRSSVKRNTAVVTITGVNHGAAAVLTEHWTNALQSVKSYTLAMSANLPQTRMIDRTPLLLSRAAPLKELHLALENFSQLTTLVGMEDREDMEAAAGGYLKNVEVVKITHAAATKSGFEVGTPAVPQEFWPSLFSIAPNIKHIEAPRFILGMGNVNAPPTEAFIAEELTTLSLETSPTLTSYLSTWLKTPNITKLRLPTSCGIIYDLYTQFLFPSKPILSITSITFLDLTRSLITESSFCDHLQYMPKLETLVLANTNIGNQLVETLVLTGKTETDRCLGLQHLDLSHSSEVTGGPLCRMVKSRLSITPSKESSSAPQAEMESSMGFETGGHGGMDVVQRPVKVLKLDGCGRIEDTAMSWLKLKVPKFTAKAV